MEREYLKQHGATTGRDQRKHSRRGKSRGQSTAVRKNTTHLGHSDQLGQSIRKKTEALILLMFTWFLISLWVQLRCHLLRVFPDQPISWLPSHTVILVSLNACICVVCSHPCVMSLFVVCLPHGRRELLGKRSCPFCPPQVPCAHKEACTIQAGIYGVNWC